MTTLAEEGEAVYLRLHGAKWRGRYRVLSLFRPAIGYVADKGGKRQYDCVEIWVGAVPGKERLWSWMEVTAPPPQAIHHRIDALPHAFTLLPSSHEPLSSTPSLSEDPSLLYRWEYSEGHVVWLTAEGQRALSTFLDDVRRIGATAGSAEHDGC